MASHYHVAVASDLGTYNQRLATHRPELIHPEIDPCHRGARFTVHDEDGAPLINFELEQNHELEL